MTAPTLTARIALTTVLVATVAGCLAPSKALAQQDEWPSPIHDDQLFWFLLFDSLELVPGAAGEPVEWDVDGWLGGDFNKLRLKSEGERVTRGAGGGEVEVQALYSRLVAPFWELQAGVRHDTSFGPGPDRSRSFLVLGLQGLAPYWFEVEPAFFLSDDGDLSARLTASTDLLLTQRLILQPEIEIDLAASTVEAFGVGSGLTEAAVDLRLRYEIRRELAPYVGLSWSRRFGKTAELARSEGEQVVTRSVLVGLRIWF